MEKAGGIGGEKHHLAVQLKRTDFREIIERDGGRIDIRYRMEEIDTLNPNSVLTLRVPYKYDSCVAF